MAREPKLRLGADLEKMEAQIVELKELIAYELRLRQSSCLHNRQAECEYQPSDYSAACLPPMRVCLDCGMSEQGWGCGYVELKDEVSLDRVSRDAVYAARRGLMLWDEHKGPLLRGEVTIQDLVLTGGKLPDGVRA